MAFIGGDQERIVREIVEPVVKDAFLELFELTLKRQGKRVLLSLVLDKKEGSVSLEECALVSRDVEKRLDALDPIAEPYLLEVSSPGLDRPLRGPEDYRRFTGRLALFVVHVPVDGNYSLRGRLEGTGQDEAVLRLEGGKEVRVPFSNVKSARLVVEM
jgi:ribosome maturation factor RimP